MNRRIFLLLGLMLSFSLFAQGTPDQPSNPKDQITGDWIFNGKHQVTINADGTAQYQSGLLGTWRYLKNPEVERKYEIIWDKGIYIDTLRLSKDGKTLEGKSKKGDRVRATRALEARN